MNDCIFCKIINRELESSIVYEDDIAIAFMDIQPVNEGHTLVIPKKHYITMEDCDEETLKHLIAIVKKLNVQVAKATGAKGIFNSVMNGEEAGQEVFHVHFHIIPRYKNDGFGFYFPRGYREILPKRSLLDEFAEKIKSNEYNPS